MPTRTAPTRRRRRRITEPETVYLPPVVERPPSAAWVRALVVLAVIALAHLGLYLLLTVSSRKKVGELEERYSAARLEAAEDPGSRPRESREVPAWLHEQQVWEASRSWERKSDFVSLLGSGLLLSFLVQAGILGVLLWRSTHAVRR